MPRPALNRTSINVRVDPDTPAKIKKIALNLGYSYAKKGQIGALLDALAKGEIKLMRIDCDKNE